MVQISNPQFQQEDQDAPPLILSRIQDFNLYSVVMRNVRAISLTLVVAGMVWGCEKQSEKHPKSSTGHSPSRAVPEITLLSPGAEPRQAVRYHFSKSSQKTTRTIKMKLGMQGDLGGQPSQKLENLTVTTVVDLATEDVDASGDAHVRAEFKNVEFGAIGNQSPELLDQLKSKLALMKGLTIYSVLSDRGIRKKFELNYPTGSSIAAAQMQDVIKSSSLQSISMPLLPLEPIGIGGRWQAIMPMETNDIPEEWTLTYEALDIAPDHVQVKMELTQNAARQPMNVPDVPPEVSATLDSARLTGKGEQTLWFDSPALMSTMTIVSENSLTLKQGNQTQKMQVKISLQMDCR